MSDGRRVALVTGAQRGIGAAIAETLAADGLDVAVHNYQWRHVRGLPAKDLATGSSS